MRQGGGDKSPSDDRRLYAGECGEGLLGLQKTAQEGYLFKISRAGLDVGRRQLVGGSGETEEGAEELVTSDKDPETGGCQPKGLGDGFQGGGTGGAAFWVGDVGADPRTGRALGRF